MRIGIVTGASSGMGKAFVRTIVTSSMELDEIWLIARREERLRIWEKTYPQQKFRILPQDLCVKGDLDKLQETLTRINPDIHILVHSAGFGIMGDIRDLSREEQAEMVDLNCRSLVEITRMVLPHMETKGRMIYLASAAAFMPQPGFAVYAASKAFALSFVRALRAENTGKDLRITAVCPGSVKTEFFDRALEYKDLPAIKKAVMANPNKVVRKAWKDNLAGREVSVYGLPMKAFRLAAKVIPHSILLKITGNVT